MAPSTDKNKTVVVPVLVRFNAHLAFQLIFTSLHNSPESLSISLLEVHHSFCFSFEENPLNFIPG